MYKALECLTKVPKFCEAAKCFTEKRNDEIFELLMHPRKIYVWNNHYSYPITYYFLLLKHMYISCGFRMF